MDESPAGAPPVALGASAAALRVSREPPEYPAYWSARRGRFLATQPADELLERVQNLLAGTFEGVGTRDRRLQDDRRMPVPRRAADQMALKAALQKTSFFPALTAEQQKVLVATFQECGADDGEVLVSPGAPPQLLVLLDGSAIAGEDEVVRAGVPLGGSLAVHFEGLRIVPFHPAPPLQIQVAERRHHPRVAPAV